MNEIKTYKDYQIVIFGLILAVAIIFSTYIFTKGVIKFQKLQNQTISTTGSASQNVTSDLAVLNFSYKTSSPDLKSGYRKMQDNMNVIEEFLVSNGVDKKDIAFGLISNYEVYKRIGNYTTNDIEFYRFNAEVKVTSKNVQLITELSKKMSGLVEKNIDIAYSNVQYYVSNIDDIKIKMVGEATKNAKQRAESMVQSTNDKIGSLNSARMGVFQIVPVNSTEVSDYGINDITSIEKKVVAVVNATFTVK